MRETSLCGKLFWDLSANCLVERNTINNFTEQKNYIFSRVMKYIFEKKNVEWRAIFNTLQANTYNLYHLIKIKKMVAK